MINIIKAVLEAAETNDFSLKSIDPQEKSYNEETDNMLYKEAYEKACIGIKTCYDSHEKLYREVISNVRDEMGRTNIDNNAEKEVELHTISVNPQIDFNVLKLLEDFFTSSDLSKFNSSDEFLTVLECNAVTQRGSDPISKEGYIGPVVTLPMKGILVCENLNKAERNIMNAADELYSIYEFMSGKIVNEKNPMYLEAYARMFEYCAKLISYEIGAYGVAVLELLQIGRNFMSMNESAVLLESTNEENAKKYIGELDKLIDEIREFYAKFEYKEIIVPRKKKEHKMFEYVLGALERKYTLKIPIYKVEGVSEDVKDIVEHKFIDKIESIVKKYPNFVVLSPNWENESDMFIYITLREPFGDKEDRKDREQQAQNESAGSGKSTINIKIDHIRRKIEVNEEVQARYIEKHGYENKSIAEEHDKLCEELEKLRALKKEESEKKEEPEAQNEAQDTYKRYEKAYFEKYGNKNFSGIPDSKIYGDKAAKIISEYPDILKKNNLTAQRYIEAGKYAAKLDKERFKGVISRRHQNESISLNEASLTKAEKDALEDYEFGLPEKRTYPLNDELHINEAIKFFGYCKASDKKTLASNIVRRIIELDLVGVVTITEKHPNKKFFPEWMINTCKPTLERKGNKYTIYVDGEKVDYGTLENHSSDEEGRIVVVNESGMLF